MNKKYMPTLRDSVTVSLFVYIQINPCYSYVSNLFMTLFVAGSHWKFTQAV